MTEREKIVEWYNQRQGALKSNYFYLPEYQESAFVGFVTNPRKDECSVCILDVHQFTRNVSKQYDLSLQESAQCALDCSYRHKEYDPIMVYQYRHNLTEQHIF